MSTYSSSKLDKRSVDTSTSQPPAVRTDVTAAIAINATSAASSKMGRSSPSMLPRNPRDSLSPRRSIKGSVNSGKASPVASTSSLLPPRKLLSTASVNNASASNNNSSIRPTQLGSITNTATAQATTTVTTTTVTTTTPALDAEEQFMFEQRLTADELGVAIRKINHSGKAQLRYVRCIPLRPVSSSDYGDDYHAMINGDKPYLSLALEQQSFKTDVSVSSRSVVSTQSSKRFLERIRINGMFDNVKSSSGNNNGVHSSNDDMDNNSLLKEETSLRALTWGKKNTVVIPLSQFTAVQKGKTTERTLRNASPSCRLLSIVTKSGRGCLDIEAPTRLDRDKFATAFSVFLGVPLEEEVISESRSVGGGGGGGTQQWKKFQTPSITRKKKSAAVSEPGLMSGSTKVRDGGEESIGILPALTPSSDNASDADKELTFIHDKSKITTATPGTASMGDTMSASARKRILSVDKSESILDPASPKQDVPDTKNENDDDEDASHVSSLTGAVDQEIVEELHQAIIELRSELDASRAEAARAVKVAEQAIQSAENCSSSDWNSTVTHKAAEAAALAQKKSAEAIARARMAEERLSAERKSTAFWRRQAQAAEEEAGSLKTRSAAAEIQQAVMVEELASEKRRAARMFASLKDVFGRGEERQAKELESALVRRRELEVELEILRSALGKKDEEMKRMKEEHDRKEKAKSSRMSLSFNSIRKRQSSTTSIEEAPMMDTGSVVVDPTEQALRDKTIALTAQVSSLQKHFALLRHTAKEELLSLRSQSQEWSTQAGEAVSASIAETTYLKEKLAAESAMRLKLLNELQDIRGTVRVYCRPKPAVDKSILTIPTHDILVLNEEDAPMSFKFDRVFSPHSSQYEVFSELEEPLISSLDGFNVTLLAFGQHASGKTHTVLGDTIIDSEGLPSLESHGVQLQALKQLFTIAGHRTDRYKDSVSMTLLEVHNEKLIDLLAGTPFAEENGQVVICETRRDKRKKNSELNSEWHKGKLEILTNIDGNTVVQGLMSIPIQSFEDVTAIWRESLAKRAERLKQGGFDPSKYEKNSNVIATFHITSVNIATGVGTEGKLQFVDMAASDIAHGVKKMEDAIVTTNEDKIHFCNKSIDALNDVVNARCQFDRSVPYRNSTLTHLLRDSLEADAKVLLLCCVSSDPSNLSDTIGALRFGSRMQKVSVGKATKHIVGSKE